MDVEQVYNPNFRKKMRKKRRKIVEKYKKLRELISLSADI